MFTTLQPSRKSLVSQKTLFLTLLLALLVNTGDVSAQGTGFTYQGRLQDSGTPANGSYDLQFTLWDAVSGGTQQPQPTPVTVTRSTVSVANGIFTVQLDFGANAFPGADRFLEIGVRPAGSASFTILSPRQPVTSTPYAVRSANAATADTATTSINATTATNATQLGGIAANQYVLTSDSRMTDARAPTAGSANYLQNTTSLQSNSNFNISGNGTASGTLSANAFNATTSVGIGITPTRARLETRGAIGNTVALFGGEGTGVALVRDYPFIGFNSYFNSGWKAISPGYGGHVGIEQDIGAMTFYVNGNASMANQAVSPLEAMRITQAGRVGIGTGTPQAILQVAGAQPAAVSAGDAASAAPVLQITGGNGGDTVLSAGTHGGNGGSILIQAGDGGQGNSGGNAGSITLQPGNQGIGPNPGNPGNVLLAPAANNNLVGIGTNDPQNKLDVNGSVTVRGFLSIGFLNSAGSTQLCLDAFKLVATCSSSLRYKKDVARFVGGLEIVNRLRPIEFTWKQGGMRDVGLAAEEVEKVEPLLTFRNDKGEIEGVKYNQLSAVFVNAFKEQQAEIQKEQEQLKQQSEQIAQQQLVINRQQEQTKRELSQLNRQQAQLDALKQLVCLSHPRARVCK